MIGQHGDIFVKTPFPLKHVGTTSCSISSIVEERKGCAAGVTNKTLINTEM